MSGNRPYSPLSDHGKNSSTIEYHSLYGSARWTAPTLLIFVFPLQAEEGKTLPARIYLSLSLSLFSLPLKCCANGYLFLFVPSFLFRFFSVTQVPVNINSGLARSLLHSFSTHECLSARCKASRAINSGEGGESRKKALEARPGGKRTSLIAI